MKFAALAVLAASTVPALAQQTGVSHPPDVVVEDSAAAPVTIVVEPKPSAAKPMGAEEKAAAPQQTTPAAPVTRPVPSRPAYESDAAVYRSPAETLKAHDIAAFDPDANIVTEVPTNAHELPTGTLVRMRLKQQIETASTAENTKFSGEITDDIKHNGRVIIPAGSVLHGRITAIRGGRRISGAAMIHMEPREITLPDGTQYPVRASVVDTDQYGDLKINSEGTLVRKDHGKETLAAMSLATGGAAAAGAVVGGGVGALVGAGLGAGVSTVWWLKQDRQTHLPKDSLLIWSLTEPMEIRPLVREPDFADASEPSRSAKPALVPRARTAEPSGSVPQAYVPTN